MRVIFFGTAEFAVPSLEQLVARRHAVVMCVTQPDRPQGRGLKREPSPVKRAAERLGVPLSQPERPRAELFAALHPDVGVVAAYGQLIRRDVLELPPQGMLGVHPSLLPRYRGAAPVAWALLQGETTTGVTIFRLNERLDAGDIVFQQTLGVEPKESAEALTGRLATAGAQALLQALDLMALGRAPFQAQDESGASFAPKLTKAQGRIEWSLPAAMIERLIRATAPWPGASTDWRGGLLKIVAASAGKAALHQAPPGTVVAAGGETLTVVTGQGTLDLLEVQPAGKRRMSVQEFLAGHRIKVGERLGDTREKK